MLLFKLNEINEEWEFEGLKIIRCDNCNKFHVNILKSINDGTFYLSANEKVINVDKIIHISEYTTTKDLLNFNKSNAFLNYVISKIKIDEKIPLDIIEKCVENINENTQQNYLKIKIDYSKILTSLISINDKCFLTKKDFIFYLECNKRDDEKQTLIINNLSWLTIDLIQPFLMYFNFIIITNKFSSVLFNTKLENIDGIFVNFSNNFFNDLINFDKIADYVSINTNLVYDYKKILKELSSNGENCEKVEKLIEKI